MKPPPFRYARPDHLSAAVALLNAPSARPLAGGQSLVPMLNQRTVRPELLVDLAGLPELQQIELHDGYLSVGAMVSQTEAGRSALVADWCPVLARTIALIAHPQIRNRGTVGGSLALGHPTAELPTLAVALDARFRLRSAAGSRIVPADDFYLGPYRTALGPGELLAELLIPTVPVRAHLLEMTPHARGFPVVCAAVALTVGPAEHIQRARVAVTGLADHAARLTAVEHFLAGRRLDAGTVAGAGERAAASWSGAPCTEEQRVIGPAIVRRTLEGTLT